LAGERARRPVGAVRDEPLFQLDVLGVGAPASVPSAANCFNAA